MATLLELEQFLYTLAPKEGAMSWDNVGLLVGNPTQEVTKILIALDGTLAVAQEAVALGCDTVVTHHPIMNCKWTPVQSLREDTLQGKLLRYLVRQDLGVISMHTNLDVAPGGVNDLLAQALDLQDIAPLADDGIGRIGKLTNPMAVSDFVAFVKEKLGANGVRYADGGGEISTVGVGGGACHDYAKLAYDKGCDAFVTSDVGYHDFLDTRDLGKTLVDAGHFPTENPVCQLLQTMLQAQFPGVEVLVSQTHREVIQYI